MRGQTTGWRRLDLAFQMLSPFRPSRHATGPSLFKQTAYNHRPSPPGKSTPGLTFIANCRPATCIPRCFSVKGTELVDRPQHQLCPSPPPPTSFRYINVLSFHAVRSYLFLPDYSRSLMYLDCRYSSNPPRGRSDISTISVTME